MQKKVVIIGGGIAGLSAGCYARMNGFDVEIHEAHDLPGGLCTAWKRGGFVFDGCINWLTGSSPGSELYTIWEELGAIQGRPMFDHEIFSSCVGSDGRILRFYTDVDRLEAHMKELSPRDSAAVDKLCGIIRRLADFSWPVKKPAELMGFLDGMKMMLTMGKFMKDFMTIGGLTLGDIGSWFTDPFLRKSVSNMFFDESMPAMALFMTLGPMSKKAAGFPIGGSLEFARAIERRLTSLGGRIVYGSRVEKILERAGRAAGVRLASSGEVGADYVISAMDMRATLFSLLDGTRIDPIHRELLDTGRLYSPALLLSFGVNMDFSSEISCLGTAFELDKPLTIAGKEQSYFGIKNYCYDPSLAPKGKSVVGTFISSDWSYWEKFLSDRAAYDEEKERIRAACAEQIELRYPGFASKVETSDVATPATFLRYTGNWKGTFMTWMLSGEFQRKHRFIPKTVPGLAGFYLASMWTNPPGGIPGAASVGRGVIQLLCHEDRKRFIASKR